jgi:heat shock protein HslJ
VPDGVEVTAVFEADKVSGNAGCNHYFAGVGGGPYDLHIGPAGSTRMACAPPLMAVEDRYLTALRNVRQFSFLYGALALTYAKDEGTGTLLFVPSGD